MPLRANSFSWGKLRLATRVMLVSGVVLMLFGATFLALIVSSELRVTRDELEQRLDHEVNFLVPAIAESAVVGDYALIKQMLEVRVRQPGVLRISWTDTQGITLTSEGDDVRAEAPAWFTRRIALPAYDTSKAIIVGGEPYGTVQLTMTPMPAVNQIWHGFLQKLVILLLTLVALFAAIFGVLTTGVRPLYAIGAAARRFGQGDYTVRIDVAGPPELAASAHAFNSMAASIEDLLKSLRDSNARNRLLATIAEQSNAAIFTKDLDGTITSWNAAAATMFGYSSEEALGRSVSILHPTESTLETMRSRLKLEQATTFEERRVARDGGILEVAVNVAPLYDAHGSHVGEICVFRDITVQKEAEETLFREKERAQVTLASIADGVITTDMKGDVEYLNPVAERLTGWRSEQARGSPLGSIFVVLDERTGKAIEDPAARVLRNNRALEASADAVLVSRTGDRYSIEDSASPIRNRDGSTIGAVLVFRDVSASRKMAHQLSWQASHDALTGLVNRREFGRRLEALVRTANEGARQHALLFLDLDQFKVVNDTCGHVAGDALLCQLSALLNNRVRRSDTLARLGGDEFAVLLSDCSLEEAIAVGESLRQTTADLQFSWQGNKFVVGASVGVVAITGDHQNHSDVLGIADAACYEAKDKGGNRVQAWRPSDRELSRRRGELLWVTRINKAIEDERFCLYAQRIAPVVRREGDRKHFEILLRMRDLDGSLVYPGSFIPAAERYNLMRLIDRQVTRMVFETLAQRGGDMDAPMVSINLSGDSLSDDTFPAFLREQFAAYEVRPENICFEVTETAAIANLGQAIQLIKELKALGCKFSLDDFGSGMSSFRYLKELPVDYLKIDGNFVRDIARNPIDAAMVDAINAIGHVMGIQTIAEWVEDDVTLAMLEKIGVDYVQGYAIDKPKPLSEIDLLRGPAGRGNDPSQQLVHA
jgi:diguanylate cyclase (GGDEF)-like protein/PAS domain S-box-containing protein